MSDPVISAILVLVLVGLVAAFVLRYNAVTDFNQKRRARDWATYVAETIRKQPHLNRSHGFFIDPKLSQHAVDALKKQMPQALIGLRAATISVTLKDFTWTIPVCTTEEYTELYI
jgi:hypothetical protein